MSSPVQPSSLPLPAVAHRCTAETERFFHRQPYDPQYCFELFRRGLLERNQRAVDLIYREYHALVAGWVVRHPAFASAGEEVDYFVNRAFEKLWLAITPDRWPRFPDLKSILRYLQMCVHSAILDHARSAETAESLDEAAEEQGEAAAVVDRRPDAVDSAMADDERRELWRIVRTRVPDEREQLLIFASFTLALKPREICDQYPSIFHDVRDVYRTKENVLQRLRRDPELQRLVGGRT